MKSWMKYAGLAALVLLAARIAYVKTRPRPPAGIVSLADMLAEYQDNPIEADSRYAGHRVRVAGFARDFGRNDDGTAYAVFSDRDTGLFIPGLKALFDASDEPALAELVKGQLAYAECRVRGYSVLVIADECAVTPPW